MGTLKQRHADLLAEVEDARAELGRIDPQCIEVPGLLRDASEALETPTAAASLR